jgi:hypothetical protein
VSGAPYNRRWRRTARPAPWRAGWAGWAALFAFGLRALVPLGFEPGAHSLTLELCHEGFPSGFFTHRAVHHGAPVGRAEAHCTFCNGTTPAPAYAFPGLTLRAADAVMRVESEPDSILSAPLAYTPQARAPPTPV